MTKLLLLLLSIFIATKATAKEAITGEIIARDADKTVGSKYLYGGNSLERGIDCSALVKKIYGKYGYKIPRRATWQAKDLPSCPTYTNINDVRVGDTLYFKNKKGLIHHVSIVTDFDEYGNIIMTHAKGKNFGVVKEKIEKRYLKEFIGAKRFYQCTSVLGNFYTNAEIAEAVLYFSNKNNIDPEIVYMSIVNIGLTPLKIVLKNKHETRIIAKELKIALESSDLKVKLGEDRKYLYLFPSDIKMAKSIAYGLKNAEIKFWAGLTLLYSEKVNSKEIEKIFYPLPNLRLNKEKIIKCFSQNDTHKINECMEILQNDNK